jgi:hypothetical protein
MKSFHSSIDWTYYEREYLQEEERDFSFWKVKGRSNPPDPRKAGALLLLDESLSYRIRPVDVTFYAYYSLKMIYFKVTLSTHFLVMLTLIFLNVRFSRFVGGSPER